MPYQMPNGKWRGTRMIQGRVRTKSFPTKAEAKKMGGRTKRREVGSRDFADPYGLLA